MKHSWLLLLVLALLWPYSIQPAQACSTLCSQIYMSGGAFRDSNGPWRMQGVQFFLPQYGINGKSLWDFNYAAAIDDGTLEFWLGKAASLHTNLLRVFIDLPTLRSDGSLRTPTSPETIYDLAQRSENHGMRLGLVLHNSASWSMSSDQSAWINALLSYFESRQSLSLIAYLNADNEINNHCNNQGYDCFDAVNGESVQSTIDGAMGWVAAFRSVVKAYNPTLLVTVGMTTERPDADNTRAVFNFFKADSQGRRLVDLVDFLSPHNYSGQAGPIIADLRIGAGYQGPVVLEEYGFPTDPAPRNPLWSEGAFLCRLQPLNQACINTAPWFVALSLDAMATKGYAGGVAWTIADLAEKNVSNACTNPNVPFDLWTGLFAIGGAYCTGGTYSRGMGQPKATAILVCIAYGGSLLTCDDPSRPLYHISLPHIAQP